MVVGHNVMNTSLVTLNAPAQIMVVVDLWAVEAIVWVVATVALFILVTDH